MLIVSACTIYMVNVLTSLAIKKPSADAVGCHFFAKNFNTFLACFCHLLIKFANSLDSDQDRQTDFFHNLLFEKNLSETPSECEMVWIHNWTNIQSALILVQCWS